LDENLLSVGRRNALERLAYLLAFLVDRASTVGLLSGSTPVLPITQSHAADTLGLSLVHINKTARRLAEQKLARWRDRGCEVLDVDGLARIAGWTQDGNRRRPFI